MNFKTILERKSNKEILSWIGLIILLRSSHFRLYIVGICFFLRDPFSDTCLYILFRYFVVSLVFLRFTVAREKFSVLSTLFALVYS